MTTDLSLAALKSWITYRAAAYPVLSGVPILLRDTQVERPGDDDEDEVADFDATFISLNDVSTEEHAIQRGCLTMDIEVMLCTVPGDLGKTDAEHAAFNAALYNVIADTAAIEYCSSGTGIRCFDIRGTAPTTEADGAMRATTFKVSMVACVV